MLVILTGSFHYLALAYFENLPERGFAIKTICCQFAIFIPGLQLTRNYTAVVYRNNRI